MYFFSKAIKKIQIASVKGSNISRNARVGSRANVFFSSIGKWSYIGNESKIIHAEVGNYTSIGDAVHIGGPSHPINWVSTSPIFCTGKNILGRNAASNSFDPYKKTTIGHDVWIGDCVLIKANVVVSTGAVIGMGSVVTKNVGPYEIWAGNPAKLIRKRFDDDTIQRLLATDWYNWSDKMIDSHAHLFTSPQEFLESQNKS